MAKTLALKIDLSLSGGNEVKLAVTSLDELKQSIRDLSKLKGSLDIGSEDFGKVSRQLSTLQGLYRNLAKDGTEAASKIADANRQLNEPPKAIGYYRQLQIELVKLKNQFKDLDEASAKGDAGTNLAARVSAISKELKSLDGSLGDYQRNVGNYGSAFGAVGGAISKVSGIVGVALGALQGGSRVIESTKQFESLFAVLKNNIGDGIEAARVFESLRDFAAGTPVQLSEVTEAYNILSRDGIRPTIEEIRQSTDLALSQGKSLNQFAEAIADAQTGEFERLKEFGIVARTVGDQVTISFKDQTETFKKGSPEITRYITELGKLPGVAGSAAAVSNTLGGAISNFNDAIDRAGAAIGSGGAFGGAIKSIITDLTSLINAFAEASETKLSDQIIEQKNAFNGLVSAIKIVNPNTDEYKRLVNQLKAEYPDYIKFIGDNKKGNIDLNATLEYGNKLFEQRIFLQQNEEQIAGLTKKKLDAERSLTQALIDQQRARQGNLTEGQKIASGFVGTGRLVQISEEKVSAFREEIKKTDDEIKAITDRNNQTGTRLFGDLEAYKKAQEEIKKTGESAKAAAAGVKTISAAEGSIESLTKKVEALKKELDGASPDKVEAVAQKLLQAEKALKAAQERVDFLKEGGIEKFSEGLFKNITGRVDVPAEFKFVDPDSGQEISPEQLSKFVEGQVSQEPVELPLAIDEETQARLATGFYEKQQELDEHQAERRKQLQQELSDFAVEAAEQTADAIFEIEKQGVSDRLESAKSALSAEYEAKIDAAQGNAALQDKLRKELAEKQKEADRKAAEERRKIARKEATVQFAIALVKAIGNPIQIAAASVQYLLSLALIDAQRFAKGGQVKKIRGGGLVANAPNAPRTSDGDSVLAYLTPGEIVLNKDQQERIRRMAGSKIFHHAGVPGVSLSRPVSIPQRFANGGIVSAQQPVVVSVQLDDEQIERMAQVIADRNAASSKEAVMSGVLEASEEARRQTELAIRIG